MKVHLKYIVEDRDRHGSVRLYFRKRGQEKIRIREQFGTAAFFSTYDSLMRGLSVIEPEKTKPVQQDSLNWLCRSYYQRAAGSVTDLTMQSRKNILDKVCDAAGHTTYRDLDKKVVAQLRDDISDTPGARNNIVKAISALYRWAIDVGLAETNPATGIKRLDSGDGFHSWSIDEVKQYIATYPSGTKAYRLMLFLLMTGLRVSDISRLGPEHVTPANRIVLRPSKTKKSSGAVVDIPILAPLMVEIRNTPTTQAAFIVNDKGLPFTPNNMSHKMRAWCAGAGLPQCSAHGLRKVGATIAAECGATAHELTAIYGWTTLQQADLYTRNANRGRLADSGMARVGEAMAEILSVPLLELVKSEWDSSSK